MQYLLLDPQPQARSEMLALLAQHSPVLGIEVTVPELAAACMLNIDPQHTDGNADQAAIEVAAGYVEELADFQTIAIQRPDADAIGAAAVLSLYQDGRMRTDAINQRIGQIADGDAMRTLDTPDWAFHALNQFCLRSHAPLGVRVETLAGWLISGELPLEIGRSRAGLEAEAAEVRRIIRVKDGIAIAETTLSAVTWVGHSLANVTVALNPACTLMSDTPYRKHTIAVRPGSNALDLAVVLADLRRAEPAWGGNLSGGVIGSTQGADSPLDQAAVLEVVRKHMRYAPPEALYPAERPLEAETAAIRAQIEVFQQVAGVDLPGALDFGLRASFAPDRFER